jgi:hypothetical protein
MIVNAFIVFQEYKKEISQKFDNLPVHVGQLEFRESLVKSLLGLDSDYNFHNGTMFYNVFLGVHLAWHDHSKQYILSLGVFIKRWNASRFKIRMFYTRIKT